LKFFARFFCGFNSKPLNPNPTPQEVPPPMQDEHGDAMLENEWVHESSKGCCKVNACIGSYVAKWLLHKHMAFRCNWVDLGVHLFVSRVLGNKITFL
jgi:hypothetical protein